MVEPTDAATRQGSHKCPLQELRPACLETAFRSQTHGQFFETYLPHASGSWPQLETNLSVLPSTSWLHAAATVAPTDTILNNALTALALAHIGRDQKRQDLLHGGRRLYTSALSGLNRKLSRKHESLHDNTLAAVMALSIYEVCNPYAHQSRFA